MMQRGCPVAVGYGRLLCGRDANLIYPICVAFSLLNPQRPNALRDHVDHIGLALAPQPAALGHCAHAGRARRPAWVRQLH